MCMCMHVSTLPFLNLIISYTWIINLGLVGRIFQSNLTIIFFNHTNKMKPDWFIEEYMTYVRSHVWNIWHIRLLNYSLEVKFKREEAWCFISGLFLLSKSNHAIWLRKNFNLILTSDLVTYFRNTLVLSQPNMRMVNRSMTWSPKFWFMFHWIQILLL